MATATVSRATAAHLSPDIPSALAAAVRHAAEARDALAHDGAPAFVHGALDRARDGITFAIASLRGLP